MKIFGYNYHEFNKGPEPCELCGADATGTYEKAQVFRLSDNSEVTVLLFTARLCDLCKAREDKLTLKHSEDRPVEEHNQ